MCSKRQLHRTHHREHRQADREDVPPQTFAHPREPRFAGIVRTCVACPFAHRHHVCTSASGLSILRPAYSSTILAPHSHLRITACPPRSHATLAAALPLEPSPPP